MRQVLEGLGVDDAEIDEAEAAGTAELLAIDRLVLLEPGKYTLVELAEKVGADPAIVRAFWRGLGFVDPVEDERLFTKTDVHMLETIFSLADEEVIDPALALQIARVLGQSMSQIAAAVIDATEAQVVAARANPDEPRPTSFALRSGQILPFLSEAVDYSFRRHLRAAARRRVDVVMDVESSGQVVGFADLVGFTELSLELDDEDLGAVVGRFDEVVNAIVVAHGGRVVKMIGDGAMFSVADPADGAVIGIELAAAASTDPKLPGARVGMAYGPILARDGDLYGAVVNLASRLVGVGRAGAVNVSPELRDEISGDPRFALRSLGTRNLRHIGDVRVYRLRPGPRG